MMSAHDMKLHEGNHPRVGPVSGGVDAAVARGLDFGTAGVSIGSTTARRPDGLQVEYLPPGTAHELGPGHESPFSDGVCGGHVRRTVFMRCKRAVGDPWGRTPSAHTRSTRYTFLPLLLRSSHQRSSSHQRPDSRSRGPARRPGWRTGRHRPHRRCTQAGL
jgi:hypothetical protein